MIAIHPTDLDRARLAEWPTGIALDIADYTGRVIPKPWGKEWEVYRNEMFSIWRLVLKPDSETSMHAHVGKRTILVVEEGAITFSTLEKPKGFTLCAGQMVVIEKGTFHKSATVGGAILMEIESPPVKNDLVRLSDKYGREGQGYEIA